MKICLITNIYPPFHREGAEQVVTKIVDGLVDQGHHVVVITGCPEGEYVEKKGNVTIYRFSPRNIYFYTEAHKHSFFSRGIWHIRNMFHIAVGNHVTEILQKEKPDVVHTHNLMGLSFIIPRVIRTLRIPHVHTVHDVQLVEPSGIIYKAKEHTFRYTGIPTRLYTFFVKKLFGSPHIVISPSDFLKRFYQDRGFFQESRTVVLRNPFTFSPQEYKEKTYDGVFRFMYVGQIEEHKGVRMLVQAFSRLLQKNVELHIVGNGSQLEQIKQEAQKDPRIHIHGRVDREELAALFPRMDMTVVPSLCYENSPTVIFESISFGVPVLASHIEGVAELIEEEKNGYTFVAGDEDALKEKMHWSTVHAKQIESMREKAVKTLKGYHVHEYVEELEALYLDAIARI